MVKAVGMGGQYDRNQAKVILNQILDFIDHGEITDVRDEISSGHPCLYLLHTYDEVQAELDASLAKDEYNRYDICYLGRKLIKFALGEYDNKTTVKLMPRNMTMPAGIKIQDGKPYIVDASDDLRRFLGWEIISINRVAVDELLADIEAITAYATPEWLSYKQETTLVSPMLASLPHFKGGLGMMRYGVKKGNATDEIETSVPNDYTMSGFQAGHGKSRNYSYRIIDDCLVIQYSMCRDKYRMDRLIADAGRDVKKHAIDKFVIDLRNNSGGNPCLTRQLLDFLDGHRVAAITNGRIYSCGAMACASLRQMGAYFVGTDIGTSLDGFGNSQKIAMDDVGLSVTRSSDGYYKWDEQTSQYHHLTNDEFRQTYNRDNLPQLTFFHPDEQVDLTVDDIIAGRDPQLDAVLHYLK